LDNHSQVLEATQISVRSMIVTVGNGGQTEDDGCRLFCLQRRGGGLTERLQDLLSAGQIGRDKPRPQPFSGVPTEVFTECVASR
jgi:hypothetical protein